MKKISKVWNVISIIFVVIVVLLAMALVGVRLMGIKPFIVLSGSMEPVYPVGSMIYVGKADPEKLKPGDSITFKIPTDILATHEIVRIVEADAEHEGQIGFKTKGIANDEEDGGTVWSSQIIGKPLFMIPYLGYVSSFIQSPAGIYVVIAIVILMAAIIFLPELLRDDKKDGKKKKEKPEEKSEEKPEEKPEDKSEEKTENE